METNSIMQLKGNLFFWDGGVGSADASTLGIPVGGEPYFLPDFLAVTSHRTGHTVPFRFDRIDQLNVEDLAVAVYSSTEGYYLHVYND